MKLSANVYLEGCPTMLLPGRAVTSHRGTWGKQHGNGPILLLPHFPPASPVAFGGPANFSALGRSRSHSPSYPNDALLLLLGF